MNHVYYGEGKGKTTAAAGLALRAAGRGKRVLFLQFLKGSASGEITSMMGIANIALLRDSTPWKFSWNMDDGEKAQAAERTLFLFEQAVETAREKGIDLLVLDEALGACQGGFLPEKKLVELMALCREKGRPELVVTGRYCFPEAMDLADYATEMRKVKHPFDEGVGAREGIEY